jgi:hypothetical protein
MTTKMAMMEAMEHAEAIPITNFASLIFQSAMFLGRGEAK